MTTQERTLELQRLESYFAGKTNIPEQITLEGFMKLNNPQVFIRTNFDRAHREIERNLSEPCIYRLQMLERFFENSSKDN